MLPVPALYYAAGAVLAIAVIFGGTQTVRLADARADLQAERRERAEEVAKMQVAAREQIEGFRLEEQRRAAAHKEIADETQRIATRARAAAAGAAAADVGLRGAARLVAAGCRAAASDPTTPTSGPADRLADVLAESTGRYRAVAEASDRAIIAGQWCAAAYDALTAK